MKASIYTVFLLQERVGTYFSAKSHKYHIRSPNWYSDVYLYLVFGHFCSPDNVVTTPYFFMVMVISILSRDHQKCGEQQIIRSK